MNDYHRMDQPTLSRSQRLSRKSGRGNDKKKKKGSVWLFFKWFMLGMLVLFLGGFSWAAYIFLTTEKPPLDAIAKINYSSVVKDAKGTEIGRIGREQREFIDIQTLKKTNPLLVQTIKKVEDVRFDQHSGIDYFGLGRALVKNIIHLGNAEGGGTITMQVARNIILNNKEKTYTRKIRELAIAKHLGESYDKEKILEAYLNYIDFHPRAKGIAMAAKLYFDKDLKKDTLTPEQVAILCGLPKSPSGYNPTSQNPKIVKRAQERRDLILGKMATEDEMPALISQSEAEKYKQQPLSAKNYTQKYLKGDNTLAAAYLDLVDEELEKLEADGKLEPNALNRGLVIYTNLEQKVQKAVDKALKNDDLYVSKSGKKQTPKQFDAGITVIKPDTGAVVAVGGGRQYQPTFTNRALEPRQPGSSIKPLTVYTPAIEKGYNEYTKIKDEEIYVGDKKIENFTKRYYGEIYFKDNVKQSLNASTVKILQSVVGLPTAFNYAKSLGLPLVPEDQNVSPLALGGLTKGVSTLDMAQAFTVYPQSDGKVKKAYTIEKIVDPASGEIYNHSVDEKDVFTPKASYYMTRMLKAVVMEDGGTGTSARLKDGRPVAGKTGTSQLEKDVWFVGYTPQYVAAVNVFNLQKPYAPISSKVPASIFSEFMSEALEGVPAKDFPRPPGVVDPQPPAPETKEKLALTGHYNEESKAVELKWTDLGKDYSYQLLKGEGNPSTPVPVSGTSYLDKDVKEGKTYAYQVVAVNKSKPDEKLESNVETITVSGKKEEEKCQQIGPDGKYDLNDPACKRWCDEHKEDPKCKEERTNNDCGPGVSDDVCDRANNKAKEWCRNSTDPQCEQQVKQCIIRQNGVTTGCRPPQDQGGGGGQPPRPPFQMFIRRF
ncbi:transglycosylase domain-containing protein [Thermoflavimicrobium dichotomicum]|uniref:Penicillin-binding protein 2A n=1 Tax=Thermoflavimicrobium dichotomicum TaxID=46223 RepID=A0A1I3RJH9_9BACL|nr:transglycosylase domain-containing protein [Thermoflavimicrobium dichotomicum]SFJ46190.1 penicillin-binding protein 2A [Thermoflavimicrobium dichotomicum]